ncbi:hypothetical protein [Limnobacter sp.]|uniref:hypothetical protein n=1 Tax=Limnobacter sp. TaxID=2003368 RepID=UPI002732E6FC|nr:hypothetical protein [Limnobacter sp.]MDP3273447.1 hypothetical protein [Limnobacter sp.]
MDIKELLSFNAVEKSEEGYWHEFQHKGKAAGFAFLVLGEHSTPVRAHLTERAKEMTRKQAQAAQKGQELAFSLQMLDNIQDDSIESALVRVVNWRGIKGEFDREVVRQFMKQNPYVIADILAVSRDLGNFT